MIGLVTFALLAMAPQMRSVEDEEENPGAPEFAMVVSPIDDSLSFRGTAQTREDERNVAAKVPALIPGGVRDREPNVRWHGGRSILASFCLFRC